MRGLVLAGFGRDFLRMAAIGGLCAGLSACGVSTLTSPFKGGLFGGGDKEAAAPEPGVNQANLVAAAQSGQGDTGGLSVGSIGCPSLSVSSGDRSVTVHAPGAAADNLSVMHRGEITNTARECAPTSSGLAVKLGFSGRVLLGPRGKAGTLTLPAKVTVVDGARNTLKSEKVRVVINVPAGSTAGYFSEVRDVVLPIAADSSAKSYRIYVGFDQSAVGSR
jgi:hypothetical protein